MRHDPLIARAIKGGSAARCTQAMGTIHGAEVLAVSCPDISAERAASIAEFCRAA